MIHWTITFVLAFCIVFYLKGQNKNNTGTDTEIIIDAVEYSATYPGGVDSLKSFVSKNLKRDEDDPKGKVFVQFTVNTDGTTSDFKVLRGLNDKCDERAIEVLRKMPRWTPGRQSNIPVRQKFVMPVQF